MDSVKLYEAGSGDRSMLNGKRVAVIGWGSQGHAHALNLHDSGVSVVVGLREGSRSAEAARQAGLEVAPVAKAAKSANVVSILIPDTVQPTVYRDEIAPNLHDGDTLLVAHGFNVHYKQIVPPKTMDVIMVAPKAPGAMVRSEYVADASGTALQLTLAYADALGCTRAGVLETTFAAETETDLFGEQTVLCGGVTSLIKAGFETLVDAGYPEELAYFECLHELKFIVDLIQSQGLKGMRAEVSDTAEYGDYVGGPQVIGNGTRKVMQKLLDDIRSGAFARRWIADGKAGGPELTKLRESENAHPIEDVGRRLRARMAWL
jgi:ketol-acid reductoisomerase